MTPVCGKPAAFAEIAQTALCALYHKPVNGQSRVLSAPGKSRSERLYFA
jgi:hypothetical protein